MRLRAAAGLALLALLAGCAQQEPEGVGAGQGMPQRPTERLSLVEEPRMRTAAALHGALNASDESGSNWGRLFDNSRRRAPGDASGGVVAAGWEGYQTRAQVLPYTSGPRRDTLATGEIPPPQSILRLEKPDPKLGSSGASLVLANFDAFQKATYQSVTEVFSRGAWGAGRARGSMEQQNPNRVTVHHTDGHSRGDALGGINEMRSIQSFHVNGRGWNDIGYHFVIDGQGRVYEGRPADVLGAHAGGGANVNNVGIAVMGNYNREQLNDAQKTTMRRLITFLALRYHGDTSRRSFIQPHKHYTSTDCPGTHISAFLDQLRREVDGETRAIAASAGPRASFTPLAIAAAR